MGVRTVAEVYRTLDKLAIRKEYHEALLRHGMDLDAIVAGIKDVAVTSEESAVRLNAYKTLLKSLGLDEYKETDADVKRSWEDVIRGVEEKETKLLKADDAEYEVIEPTIPEEVLKRREEEKAVGQELYE